MWNSDDLGFFMWLELAPIGCLLMLPLLAVGVLAGMCLMYWVS